LVYLKTPFQLHRTCSVEWKIYERCIGKEVTGSCRSLF